MAEFANEMNELFKRIQNEPSLGKVPELVEADNFRREIETKSDYNYTWVNEYARYSFDRVSTIYKILDDKASDIIKNLGGGTGLVALGSLASTTSANVATLAALLPSFAMALIAIIFATKARGPNEARELPKVSDAIRYVEAYGDTAQADFLGQWNYVIEAMYEVVKRKADRVDLATRFYVGAIGFLALPMIVTVVRLLR